MKILDHVGIAVEDLDAAIAFYKDCFGFSLESRETIEDQNVAAAFIKLDNTLIELLAALNQQSTLTKFLSRRGPGLHHLSYRVDDLSAELSRLESLGVQLIDKAPRPGANNTIIAFLHPRSTQGVLTELCQYLP